MSNTPVIQISNVKKVYAMGANKVFALRGVNLTVESGEMIAIMGTSGSGKSTLMNIIGCLDRPTSGRYRLAGREVGGLSRSALAQIRDEMLGFVFQHFNLLPRTSALENVELPLVYSGAPARKRRERARNALARVGLADRADHQPSQLSGGQQQRVAIARALVNEPRLIVADEPTGALDSRTSMEVMEIFQDLARSKVTILLVTHEPDIGRCAERLLFMRDGRILSDHTQSPIVARPARVGGAAEVSA
jgi:putative ABC transport system ATP-binding protein